MRSYRLQGPPGPRHGSSQAILWCPSRVRESSPIRPLGAPTRPRRALGLNGPLLTDLPTLGSGRPGATLRPISWPGRMTGFDGNFPLRIQAISAAGTRHIRAR